MHADQQCFYTKASLCYEATSLTDLYKLQKVLKTLPDLNQDAQASRLSHSAYSRRSDVFTYTFTNKYSIMESTYLWPQTLQNSGF